MTQAPVSSVADTAPDAAADGSGRRRGVLDGRRGVGPTRPLAPAGHRRLVAIRIAVAFAGITILPLGVLAFAAIELSDSAVTHDVRARMTSSAVLEARAVGNTMTDARDLVAWFARRSAVVGPLGNGDASSRDLPALQAAMAQVLQSNPGFVSVSVLDPSGHLISISPPTPSLVGVDLSYRDWYHGVTRTGKPYVSEVFRSKVAGTPLVVAIAAAVRQATATPGPAGTGALLGYLVATYGLSAIERSVESFERGQGVALTVTDQHGLLVAGPQHPDRLISVVSDPRVRRALAGETGTMTVAGDLSGFAPVPGLDWAVHADIRESTAFAAVNDLRSTVGAIAGGLALLLLVGSALLGRAWRGRMESEARELRAARYNRSLLEASLDPMVTISPEGRVTDVNDAAVDATGRRREEMVGSDFSEYFTDRAAARKGYERAFTEGSVADYPLTIRHRDGHLIDVLYNASVYRVGDGQVGGVFAAARDVTELRRNEAELSRRAREIEQFNLELGRSNQELEQFAYVASHDLSEPLRAISGPVSLLGRQYRGQLDADADRYIDFAVDGCQRMQRMIDDLLTYSRVGRLERPFEPTDTHAVVSSVLTALAPTLEATGATVQVGELPVVVAETNQLDQLFQNLISNALKFARPGVPPELSIASERVGSQWRFSVADNGIGIEPQYRDRVFGMFKRLHGREEYPGTGIGLAVAKKIVERHGGRIGIEDNPTGPGTRVWFTLPAQEAR